MKREIEAYLSQRQSEGLAESSLNDYRTRLLRLSGFLRERNIRRWAGVEAADLDAFQAWLRQLGLAWSNREGIVIAVRCFFRWLAERGLVLSNPARHLRAPRPGKGDLPLLEPPLSEKEVAEFLDGLPRRNALDLRNIALCELLYSAALRLGESLALDLRDIDMGRFVVHVRSGKGGKPRDLPMMRGLHQALAAYLAVRQSLLRGPDNGALLVNLRGRRLNKGACSQIFKRFNRQRGPAQRRLHAHLFRHSIAVHLLRGGAEVRVVQEFLGHESLESTRNYLRLVPADLRKAYDAAMPDVDLGL